MDGLVRSECSVFIWRFQPLIKYSNCNEPSSNPTPMVYHKYTISPIASIDRTEMDNRIIFHNFIFKYMYNVTVNCDAFLCEKKNTSINCFCSDWNWWKTFSIDDWQLNTKCWNTIKIVNIKTDLMTLDGDTVRMTTMNYIFWIMEQWK